eukprot:CAMPEP_0113574384 /NCGR_PEP_ID=MMETSP0015_2-20120614/27120_1 /TAXON_ID=2838 /ORGANISM="Odontella" /LENGTH=426 /DNA_ID=CAMNT_0000477521 /DNA_START=76 /DNA_END=1356 /DNA_ORIENTATION=- /assembly_acc=CAM_ASM_000160
MTTSSSSSSSSRLLRRPLLSVLTLLFSLGPRALGAAAGFHSNNNNGGARAKAAARSIPHGGGRGGEPAAEPSVVVVEQRRRPLTPADLAVAGAIATMIGDACLHPIDCVKTLQQSGSGASLGFVAAGRKIFADQGVGGFYSGLGTYIAADGGAGAVKFATYEVIKKWVSDRVPEEYVGAALFGCAAAAYMASSVVLIPGELIKQRMQMGQASGFTSAVSSIWKNDGITGFFAGYQGVWLRDIPYTALELGIYDNIKTAFLKYRKNKAAAEGGGDGAAAEISQADEIIAGGIAGGITGYLTNPLDLIKTKLMVEGDLYSGLGDAARRTFQDGGLSALFHGAGARVGYILPFCALYLPVYEVIKRRLERSVPKEKVVAASAKSAGKVGRGGAQQQQQMMRRSSGFAGVKRRNVAGRRRLDGEENFVSF